MIDLKSREEVLKQLYIEFHTYFVDELRKAKTETQKIRLHLVAEFFDDVSLYNKIDPLFKSIPTTLAEKKAVARAALWDALVAAHFGSYTEKLTGFISNRLADLEDFVANLKKLPSLATHTYVQGIEKRVGEVEAYMKNEITKVTSKAELVIEEPTNGVPEGQQVGEGPSTGVQKQDDSLGVGGVEEAGC